MRFLIICFLVVPLTAWSKTNIELGNSVNCLRTSVARLATEPAIIEITKRYNNNPDNVDEMERKWPSLSKESTTIRRLVNNSAAQTIQRFIHGISIQGEGFVIGANGGLAAATNKTSDFWQGDEAQFTQAITLPPGKTKVFKARVDQSAETVVIKITTPIYSKEKQQNIGVLVIGFDAIVLDFLQLCNNKTPAEPND